ncbi:MAG: four helix bundle protein [Balneolaceae bacterium]|nr:four helix bundle protein [Balneolaceae bacterium]MBO6545930.1 four helix bundle protein [Balneolaceae bacterium]MBO6647326.1 four helix bundle protein [Balneolaceae bacterium]
MGKLYQNIESFEDLEVWKASRLLRKRISKFVDSLPKDEKYRLSDQLIRASRSVTANIAEGYGRFHFQENIQYCRQARGSLYEIIDHLLVALDQDWITQKGYDSLKKQTISCIKLVNGYIGYLKRSKANYVKEADIKYSTDTIN